METVEFIRVPGPEVASGDGMPSGGLPAFSVFQSVRNLVKSGLGEGTGLGCLGREKNHTSGTWTEYLRRREK